MMPSTALRLVLLSAAVGLAACSSLDMPSGYAYENEIYRSPPGPKAAPPAKIVRTGQDAAASGAADSDQGNGGPANLGADGGYTASAHRDADGTWSKASDDLVAMILRDLGRPMEKVYVPGSDAFVPDMKAALAHHDIPVAANPGDGPFVIEHEISGETATIHFFSNHEKILSESGHYPETP